MTPEQIAELEKRIRANYYNTKGLKKPKVISVIGNMSKSQMLYQNLLNMRARDPLWLQAFEEYNKANPDNQYHMGCSPCFAKVLFWHKETLINKEL